MREEVKKEEKATGKKAAIRLAVATVIMLALAAAGLAVITYVIPNIHLPSYQPTNEEIYAKAKEFVETILEDSIIPKFPENPLQIENLGKKGSYRLTSFFQFQDMSGKSQLRAFVVDMKLFRRQWIMDRMVIEDRVYEELEEQGYWWP